MARNQISFFATKDDLSSLLRAVESERRLQVVVGGMFDGSPFDAPYPGNRTCPIDDDALR